MGNGGIRVLDLGTEHYQMDLGLQFTSGTSAAGLSYNPNAIIRTSGTNTLFMYAEDGVKIMNLGEHGVLNSGYTGIGTEYRDLTARTGIFTSGIKFGDGTVQTTAAGGGGGGTPGGSNTNIQFNNAGAFSGESNFTWNYNTDALTVSGSTLISNTGTVFEVTNTGGTTLFAVEDSDEVQVIVAKQVGQTGNPFEVRDEFDVAVASINISGNISGNNIIFGDGTIQTTAAGGGGGSTTGTASGVAFFGNDNNLTESTSLTFDSGNETLNVLGNLDVTGAFTANTKSFLIDHPTKEGMKLQYGSLEGPENGVYVRGTTDLSTIELPDYWVGLVDENSITVSLTPIGSFQQLYVEDKNSKQITVGGVWGSYDYVVYAERKDVDKLEVEW